MKELEYVNFSNNSLSSFPPIMGSPRLRCLLLHSNHLSSLPEMPSLPHLHTLDLSCNQFEGVPEISSFPRLEFLDLSGNVKLTISKSSVKVLKYAKQYIIILIDELYVWKFTLILYIFGEPWPCKRLSSGIFLIYRTIMVLCLVDRHAKTVDPYTIDQFDCSN